MAYSFHGNFLITLESVNALSGVIIYSSFFTVEISSGLYTTEAEAVTDHNKRLEKVLSKALDDLTLKTLTWDVGFVVRISNVIVLYSALKVI